MHPADPLLRHLMLGTLLLSTLIAIGVVVWIQLSIAGVDDQAYEHMVETYFRLKTGMAVVAAMSSVILLVCGVLLFRFASACSRAQRYPHPGARTMYDMQVLDGPRALQRALMIRVFSVLLGLLAVAIPILVAMLWARIP